MAADPLCRAMLPMRFFVSWAPARTCRVETLVPTPFLANPVVGGSKLLIQSGNLLSQVDLLMELSKGCDPLEALAGAATFQKVGRL
jgi:hypothetical protein